MHASAERQICTLRPLSSPAQIYAEYVSAPRLLGAAVALVLLIATPKVALERFTVPYTRSSYALAPTQPQVPVRVPTTVCDSPIRSAWSKRPIVRPVAGVPVKPTPGWCAPPARHRLILAGALLGAGLAIAALSLWPIRVSAEFVALA